MISGGFTGVGLAARGDTVVASRCAGFADAAEGRRWTLQTRTQVASISKQFAAAISLLLVHQGAIALEDPVTAFLPDCPAQWRAVSIRQLLTHTSGMAHWGDGPGFDPAQPLEPAQRIAQLLAAPLTDRPGQSWCYSSPGYVILAAVLEQAAGRPYPELVEDLVIGPLELTATTVGSPLAGDFAVGYRHGQPVIPWQLHAMAGTGDICSNATDLARFFSALHGGALLPAQIQPLLHSLVVPQRSSVGSASTRPAARIASTGYCAGHFHGAIDGRFAYLHPGDNPGYQSLAAWLPDSATVIVVLSNDEDADLEETAADLSER